MRNESPNFENHIYGIDGCRALACLGVFTVNYLNKVGIDTSQSLLDYGEISGRFGIVTLIVLSGFGLSIPFWEALAQKRSWPSTPNFWIRRFLRIAPLYYLCLVALIVHNEVWKKAHGWMDISLHFSFLYNYSNAYYYSLNPVFWVLAFFMHFYLVLPILFWFGNGSTKNALAVFLSVILFAYLVHSYLSFLAGTGTPGVQTLALRKSFFAYLPHFLTGTLAGWIYVTRAKASQLMRSRLFSWLAFWLIIFALIVSLGTPIADYLELPYAVYHFPLTNILIALLLLSAAMGSGSILLESPPIKVVAVLSYGIFVFHYPVINLSLRLLPKLGVNPHEHVLLTALFALLATLCIAAVTYVCVERPVEAISRKLSS